MDIVAAIKREERKLPLCLRHRYAEAKGARKAANQSRIGEAHCGARTGK
jgi:hypothetical protein